MAAAAILQKFNQSVEVEVGIEVERRCFATFFVRLYCFLLVLAWFVEKDTSVTCSSSFSKGKSNSEPKKNLGYFLKGGGEGAATHTVGRARLSWIINSAGARKRDLIGVGKLRGEQRVGDGTTVTDGEK